MSEIYDATFAAIRSKTSFGNIEEAVAAAIRDQGISHAVDAIRAYILDVASEYGRPSTMYRPRLFRDGNMWGCLYGDNPMDGVEGYGESPCLAYLDFDKNWVEKIKGQP